MSYPKRPRRTKSTCASSPLDDAKIVKNTEIAKQNIRILAEEYVGVNDGRGFLTDLWEGTIYTCWQ